MSAYLWEAPVYHPVLKHSRFAERTNPSRPGLTHIIPCSNILASLRSLQNCAWNDMDEPRTGGFLLENKLKSN